MIGNESVPCNVPLVKVMEDNDLDQREVVDPIHLLGIWIFLDIVCYLFNIPEHEERKIHHSHSNKMHQ